MPAEVPLSLYHLLDPEVLANPYPLYRRSAHRGPGPLGSVSARLDRHALRRRDHRPHPLLGRTGALAGILRSARRPEVSSDRQGHGQADAVPRRAAHTPGCESSPAGRSCPRACACCAITFRRSPTRLIDDIQARGNRPLRSAGRLRRAAARHRHGRNARRAGRGSRAS